MPTRSESDWERRRRLDDVFGDSIPTERGEERDRDDSDEYHKQAGHTPEGWYRHNRPPHYG